ncbi:MAG: M56 family metallopeptidase, partial [Hymenobacter sp.]
MALLPTLARQVEPCLPLLVATWLLGLLVMSGRFAGGLLVASRLRRVGVQAVGADWQRRLAALAARAGLRQPVALLESARVRGPLVLGHLRPVILLPLGALAGLPPALLEALLAHELAHIVRRDYVLNLAISVVEVLFFYHPAVWFMANCLRAERENCCDDQAAALCGGDRLRVARALAALAELEATLQVPQLALAAAGTGGRGSLLARVRRLALGRPQAPTLGEGLLAMLLGVLGVAGLSTGVALAAPAGSKAVNALVVMGKQTGKPAVAPADTTRKPRVASAAPVAADTVRHKVQVVVDNEVDTNVQAAPQVRTYSLSQQRPPRREQASTVVIEKDKKGRMVNLVVDGQPVETDPKGKKKHDQKVRTVEVVRVPNQEVRIERVERPEHPERPERPENQNFSFNFSTDAFGDQDRQSARRGLTDALRNPD